MNVRRYYSTREKLKALERELAYRRRVYPRLVASGRMSQREADEQVSVFEAIAKDYRDQIEVEAPSLFGRR